MASSVPSIALNSHHGLALITTVCPMSSFPISPCYLPAETLCPSTVLRQASFLVSNPTGVRQVGAEFSRVYNFDPLARKLLSKSH